MPARRPGATLDEMFARCPGRRACARGAHAALTEGQPFEAELPLLAGEGRKRPVWYSLSLRRADAVAAQPEAVAVLTDISRLKSQQDELERLLRERELMFSLSDVGIVYLRGRRIERANQAMATLTGYAPARADARWTAAELHADARECVDFETAHGAALRQHGRFSAERRLRRATAACAGCRWRRARCRWMTPRPA
jgi:PAS domain-containing protein